MATRFCRARRCLSSCQGTAISLSKSWPLKSLTKPIKFATKEDVYKYLETKYQDYTGEGLAKPFIMDNEKWVETK